jgi:DNA-directed RNA polymerase subunit RPC12/RpoP
MAEIFECPSCGGSLELDHDHDNLVRCQYCGKNVVVPEALRRTLQKPVEPGAKVVSIHTPVNWQAPKTINVGQIVSCSIIFVVVFIIGTTLLSIVAPLVMTGLVAKVIGDSTGILEGFNPTRVAGQSPQIILTVPSISDLIGTPTPPPPGFASLVLAFGAEGTGPGRFDDTRSVAVDPDGFIYTAEFSDHRIQKFNPQGKYETGWMADGSNAVMSMAASRNEIIYIVSTGEIYKYDTAGQFIGKVEKPNRDYIESVVITADNGLVATSNESVYRFDANEQLQFQIVKAYQTASDNGRIIAGASVDGQGNIFVPIRYAQQGKFKTAIFIFSPDGEYMDRFGSEGDQPGQFRALNALAVDGQGRIYVSDIKGIHVYTPDGSYLASIDVEGVAFGLWFDDAGALYVASNADQIFKFEVPE